MRGNRSPVTRIAKSRDYSACCHVPGPAVNDPFGTNPGSAPGADAYGVHCDFCHKVADVVLDPSTGLPFPGRPGVFWGTVVYDSYGEWLASPWSDPATGRTCQQCHMSAPTIVDSQTVTNEARGKGGVERDPLSISAHDFPGAANAELLRNAVSLDAEARTAPSSPVGAASATLRPVAARDCRERRSRRCSRSAGPA